MANSTYRNVTGLESLSSVLKGIPEELRREVLPSVIGRACKPVVKRAKTYAGRSKKTGALQASITSLVRKYKKGAVVVGVIGPDNDYYRGGRKVHRKSGKQGADQPRRYAHLVEFGHAIAKGGKIRPTYNLKSVRRWTASGKLVRTRVRDTIKEEAKGRIGGFVEARPFMRPALAGSKAEIQKEIIRGLNLGLARTKRKLVKAGQHKG